jgi:amino acid transporter
MDAVVSGNGKAKPEALALLASERPRNVSWVQAAGLLFGDWGTSRLYVLGLAFFFAGRTSFWLILAMSLLILAVAWAYAQICRIYPDGGGVYAAAKHKSRTLAVVGALLLFADYTVTASLSALDAFHYFGLPLKHQVTHAGAGEQKVEDAGDKLEVGRASESESAGKLFAWDSPGLWAIVALTLIGGLNLLGPKHSSGFAIFAAIGMMGITLTITFFALPQVDWRALPSRVGHLNHSPADMWVALVSIVLALSGVEAIANLTGVMKRPVARTARRAIWVVAGEVALFNIVLAIAMLAIFPLDRDAHLNDMLAFLSGKYVGVWGEWGVRILGGVLLLSASNTAISGMISVQYLMARDGEVPRFMQALNRFGVPWLPAAIATGVPVLVLLISHDLESLAALYAIGVIGAVAINVTLCSTHPRLRRMRRKLPMMGLGVVLLAIWVTLACTKLHALVFVTVVMVVGLGARSLTQYLGRRDGAAKLPLLRQAVLEQLTPEAMARPKILVGTYGSDSLAAAALLEARQANATLVVAFIRELSLNYKFDGERQRQTIDTDVAAQRTFARFLELGHMAGVPVLPVYDAGTNAAETIAETAVLYGCERVLIGTSRQGSLYHLIKGHFQRRLEALLPPELPVQVVEPVAVEMLKEEVAPVEEGSQEPAPH